ncbi:MAG: hypothetical protein KDK99_09200 [Verrucomicrobiales bacterium]|nr:hypothetical protein [Verrucomicrobiales bacterium]
MAQRALLDPTQTVGVETCRDCHDAIVGSWEGTVHEKSLAQLTQGKTAAEILAHVGLGTDRLTAEGSCVRCHFTQESLAGAVQTTAAVSCESCHGAAAEWIDVHNSKSLTRAERVSQAKAVGMVHPDDLVATGRMCFGCHVVDDEQLVNHGGHVATSSGFELLSWYSGEVKHNFLVTKPGRSVKSNGDEPMPIPVERRRMLFLVGKLLHLEAELRAMARCADAPVDAEGHLVQAEGGGPTYGVAHALAIQKIAQDMAAVTRVLPLKEYDLALAVMEGVPMTTGHGEEFAAAAAEVGRIAEAFCTSHDGGGLGAIDPILGAQRDRVASVGDGR